MFDEVFEKQAMERDRRMRSMGQIDFVLGGLCRSTGFGYAEVWQRAHVRANDGMVSEGGAKHSVDLARMSTERRRRSSLDVVMDFFERRVNVLVRRSSQDTRRSADVARRVQHQLLQAGAGGDGSNLGVHLGYDETLDHRLRWAGHHIYVPERFEESERLEHLGPGWAGRLEEFVTRASQKLSWYEKGKGFPGAAWGRKKVVYRDLYFLPDDDFEAGDPRVRMAKDLFDISCGIPVLHPDRYAVCLGLACCCGNCMPQRVGPNTLHPDSGQLLAVVMLYRVRCAREHRMNANWRRLHKHPGFRARINSAAHMAFWALRCAHLTCSSSMSRMQVY